MSISTDGNNLILNSTSNTISIICSSTNTLATNLYVPFGFLIPSTAITPATDEKIGRTSTINSTNGTISSATIKNLGATYTFTSPGIYLIVLYLSITPSTTPLTITNCGFGVSTSDTSFTEGTGQINCHSIAKMVDTNRTFTATFQKVITVNANLQHYFLANMTFTGTGTSFTYLDNSCYWKYIKIG